MSDSMESATYAGVIRDGQIRLDVDVRLPEGSRVTVIGPTALDERSARRKANRWLVENVGNLVMADQPALLLRRGHILWRFDALVTAPNRKPRGPIGQIDIDATTGATLPTSTSAEEMIRRGESLESAVLPAAG
ncbi:MAG: hypothetical protein KJZ86_27345 [Caldilineaceae bacterium]|nr:hypothetical protein [Caldilineaceae bacterium]